MIFLNFPSLARRFPSRYGIHTRGQWKNFSSISLEFPMTFVWSNSVSYLVQACLQSYQCVGSVLHSWRPWHTSIRCPSFKHPMPLIPTAVSSRLDNRYPMAISTFDIVRFLWFYKNQINLYQFTWDTAKFLVRIFWNAQGYFIFVLNLNDWTATWQTSSIADLLTVFYVNDTTAARPLPIS